MSSSLRLIQAGLVAMVMASTGGCAHWGGTGFGYRADGCSGCCENSRCYADCNTCEHCGCGCGSCGWLSEWRCGACCPRSHAIPETLPLGSTVRAHYQVMETNAEAADFIFHRHDFVGQTAELTPDGRDKILEIAVRMRSAPFPVLVERSENNADPELDMLRRNLVAQILTEYSTPDADCRTIISPSYGRGYPSIQAEPTYYQHLLPSGGFLNGFGGRYGHSGFGGGFGGVFSGGFGGGIF